MDLIEYFEIKKQNTFLMSLLFMAVNCALSLTSSKAYLIREARLSKNGVIKISAERSTLPFGVFLINSSQKDILQRENDSRVTFEQGSPPSIGLSAHFWITNESTENVVQRRGRFYLYFYAISFEDIQNVRVSVRNHYGYLTDDNYAIIYFAFIECVVYTAIFILCLLNKKHHPLIIIPLHQFIFYLVIVQMFLSFANALSLYSSNIIEWEGFNYIVDAIMIFRNLGLLCFMLYLAAGLSLVRDDFPPLTYISYGFISFFLAFSLFLALDVVEMDPDNEYDIPFAVLFGISYMVYVFTYYSANTNATHTLYQHLELIARAGIDPETSPTKRKIRMLDSFRTFSYYGFILIILGAILGRINRIPSWIGYATFSILTMVWYALICWKCRIRNSMATTYLDDADVYEIDENAEPQGISVESLKRWNPGTPLPPMPTLAKPSHQIHPA